MALRDASRDANGRGQDRRWLPEWGEQRGAAVLVHLEVSAWEASCRSLSLLRRKPRLAFIKFRGDPGSGHPTPQGVRLPTPSLGPQPTVFDSTSALTRSVSDAVRRDDVEPRWRCRGGF